MINKYYNIFGNMYDIVIDDLMISIMVIIIRLVVLVVDVNGGVSEGVICFVIRSFFGWEMVKIIDGLLFIYKNLMIIL